MLRSFTNVACEPMGKMPDRARVELYTLRNEHLTLHLSTYGARVVALESRDRSGTMANVALGYATLAPYLTEKNFYFGAIVGRVANRIARGRFTLDGREYQLPINNGVNTLHGGPEGFDTRNWEPHAIERGVRFTYFSDDGEEGFPGELHTHVDYILEGNTVRIETRATTDAPTIVNLANHAYFHLAGEGTPSVLDHEVTLEADAFTPLDATQIPTGELRSVEGTPFDFREPRRVGERIHASDEQITIAAGYDHNFVVRGEAGTLRPVATVYEPTSGRVLEVASTEPGVQFYSGNFLDGSVSGPSGRPYVRRSGLCLETQGFPDAVNHPNFPSVVLRPDEVYSSMTTWTFGTK
jgi:aldose 1-epimerase